MRNLKKVLTLVLTVAMLLSIMVVGTGAAFSDQSSIKNTEAVDACSALNIIAGMEDGSYRPANNVTRAQMCKMICVALNGGKEPTLGTNATPTFSDVRTDPSSSWAESFIESCNSQGIVSGVGGGRFSPSGSVTGTQAARMLLVALGYRADQEGFTGDSWAINVNTLASAKGLYKGIESIDANAAMSRDNAAQMIWNALNAYEVEYVSQLVTVDGTLTSKLTAQDKVVGDNKDKISMMEDKYETESPTGILTSVAKESGKDTYKIQINNAVNEGKAYNGGTLNYSKISTNLIDLLGQDVRVLVKPSKNGQDAVVYGVYATSKNTVVTTLVDDIDDADKTNGRFKVDGVEYKTNATGTDKAEDIVKVYTPADLSGTDLIASGGSVGTALKSVPAYNMVTFIDNDDDDKIDFGICTPFTFGKVTSKTSDSVTIRAMGGTGFVSGDSAETYDLEDDDVNVYSDIAKDDYVMVVEDNYTVDSYTNITKADITAGKATSVRRSGTPSVVSEVSIDGTWHSVANYAGNTDANNISVNDEYDFYTVNGFVFLADKTAGNISANNIVFVDKAAAKTYGTDAGDVIQANLYFADGTSVKDASVANVTVDTYNDVDIDETSDAGEYAIDKAIATALETQRLFKYSTKSNGDYELTALSGTERGSYDAYVSGNTSMTMKDGRISGVTNANDAGATTVRFDDNAVIFVKDKDNVRVMTGSSVASWKDHATPGYFNSLRAVADKSSGNYYASIGAIVLADGEKVSSGSNVKFGMIVSDRADTSMDNTDYYSFDLWNGSETVQIKVEEASAYASFGKNTFIAYTESGADSEGVMEIEIEDGYTDNQITVAGNEVKTVDQAVALMGFDANTVRFNNFAEMDRADDMVIIGVNTQDKKGAVITELETADPTSNNNEYFANAVYFMDDDEVIAIFIDSKGAMFDGTAKKTFP